MLPHWEHWIKQPFRRQDVDFGDSEIIADVLIFRVPINFGKTRRVNAIFIDAWIKEREIIIGDGFVLFCFRVQCSRPSPPSKKRVSGFRGGVTRLNESTKAFKAGFSFLSFTY